MSWNSKCYRANKTACLWFLWKLRFCNWIGLWRNQNMMKGSKNKFDSVLWSACCLPICDGAFLQADWLRWGQPTPQKSSKLSCLLCYWTNLYTKLFSPSSQPKNQSFNSATSWNLSAPTFCSAAITGACCRAKIAIMYNHQVILCPSTPNHLTKWKDLVPEWVEIPSGIVPTKQLASGSFGSSGSATESACDGNQNMMKGSKNKFDSVLWSACCLPIAMVLFCRLTGCVGVNLLLKSLQNFHVFFAIEQTSTQSYFHPHRSQKINLSTVPLVEISQPQPSVRQLSLAPVAVQR